MNDTQHSSSHKAKSSTNKKAVFGLIGVFIVAIGALVLINLTNTQTQGVGTYRNWSADAILAGGAITEKELVDAYDRNAAGIQPIYNYYGIHRNDLIGKTSQIKHGRVNRDGTVTVGGKVVAKNARSVARKIFYDANGNGPIARKMSDGTTVYEGPNMSIFLQDVDAYVFYRDGQFYRAIISSCGNPVIAEPTEPKKPKPVYSCDSLVATKINRTQFRFSAKATAKDGATIKDYTFDFGDGSAPQTTTDATVSHTYAKPANYKVKVTANIKVDDATKAESGPNCQTTITVDQPPKEPVARCDSLKATKISRDEYSFSAAATTENGPTLQSYTFDFGDGKTTTTSQSTVKHTYTTPGSYTAKVTANIKTGNETKAVGGTNCQVPIKIEEPPVAKCDSLAATKINRTKFRFNATATALHGAQIVNYTYDFGDGETKTTTSRTTDHTYAKPGNYKAKVTVTMNVNGETKTITGTNCQTTVTVEQPPKAPVYKCDLLTANPILGKERTYTYTLTHTAESGATLTKVVYEFGDGSTETFQAANAASVEHQFAQPGKYTTKATLHFTVKEETKTSEQTDACQVEIEVPKPENCPLPGKESLPKNHPECIDTPVTPETPEELPQTGIGAWISGAIGLAAIAGATYYWHSSHTNLRSTKMRK